MGQPHPHLQPEDTSQHSQNLFLNLPQPLLTGHPLLHPTATQSFKGLPPPGCPPRLPLLRLPPSLPSPLSPLIYASSCPLFPSPDNRRHRSLDQANLQWALNHGHPTTPLSPADQADIRRAHLLATSLSLRHLKPTTTHSDFLCSPRAAPPTPRLLTKDEHCFPSGPLVCGTPGTILFFLDTPECVASEPVPAPHQSSDTASPEGSGRPTPQHGSELCQPLPGMQ